MSPGLEIEGLTIAIRHGGSLLPAVEGLDLHIAAGKTVALVGESGCGKSITALAVMGLLPQVFSATAGAIRLDGRNLLLLPDKEMDHVRGRDIGMIFQEPMTSLNPMMTIGNQIAEPLIVHERLSQKAAFVRAAELLDKVHIPKPKEHLNSYPHELSGGMQQRVMIAIAISCSPKLLIADEPTTALDVTVQSHILELLMELREELGMSVLLITHDLGVVAEYADRVVVMYAGRKVEEAFVKDLFSAAQHPYTRGLLNTIPKISSALEHDVGAVRLEEIPGAVPTIGRRTSACRFADRCKYSFDACYQSAPPLEYKRAGHLAACWRKNGSA